ncbi:MAG TPA: acyl-CoA carboxylase subunit epsilon [Pseudonocardiaceae bacterium]|jgi:hypothetical protein
MSDAVSTGAGERPLLRVVRGTPSEAELAALTSVVLAAAARAGSDELPTMPRRSAWADRSALMREALHPRPGAWRASGMTRR